MYHIIGHYYVNNWITRYYNSFCSQCTHPGIPGLTNPTVLGALFSLTATGLYSSYFIPIFLRVTVSRDSFQAAEFSLGKYSIPMGWISSVWCLFMIIILCLPQDAPISANNMNYSPIALGIILVGAWFSWVVSARFWFKGAKTNLAFYPIAYRVQCVTLCYILSDSLRLIHVEIEHLTHMITY